MARPIVIVRIVDGCFEGIDHAGDVNVFCHDGGCHSEPYYKMTLDSVEDDLRREVGEGPWPNAGDERHAAITARVLEKIDGKPRLSLAPKVEPSDAS